MEVDDREVKLFILRTFKLVYQAVNVKLPISLKTEIDSFPSEETGFFFNDIISKAILLLVCCTTKIVSDEFGSLDSPESCMMYCGICVHHKPTDFLRFLGNFITKAAYSRDDESFQTVLRSVEGLCNKARIVKIFTSLTWVRLERVASRFVVEDYFKCQLLPDFDTSQQLNLEKEQSFVLRVMQYYFSLNDKNLPDLFSEEVRKLDKKDYQLTENVRKAIFYVKESHQFKAEKMEELCKKDLYVFSSFRFSAKRFFDMCICFTRIAFEDYFLNDKPLSPYRVFETLVKMLQCFRERGLLVPWEELENAASTIAQKNERNQNPNLVNSEVGSLDIKEGVPAFEPEAEIRMMREQFFNLSFKSERFCICRMCSFMKKDRPTDEEDYLNCPDFYDST